MASQSGPVLQPPAYQNDDQNSSQTGAFTAKLKLEKPPSFDSNPSKLSNWIFLLTQYLDILGIVNCNMLAKYAVVLFEGKAMTLWCSMAGTYMLDTLSWSNLYALLEAEF